MYGLTQTVAPTAEPMTIMEAKDWLRVQIDADNALIGRLIKAARGYVERVSGRQLVSATWKLTLDGFPYPGGWQVLESPSIFPDPHCIRLPRAPLQSVTSITYYDFGNTQRTLATTVYDVDARTDPGRIQLAQAQVWPVTRLRPAAVEVIFVAGYGAPASVPEEIKLAMNFMIAHWYENRLPVEEGRFSEIPLTARDILLSFWNGELEYGTP